MKWDKVKHHFEYDDGALIDIYFNGMNEDAWIRLFSWLKNNKNLSSVNCYDPLKDKNYENFPENINMLISEEGFYCFTSLSIEGITLFLRFYTKDELECDISPEEVKDENQLNKLFSVLSKIKSITGVQSYFMCPENYKKGTFNIDGVFVK
ncbi:MAG: hypothetical protein ACMUJM_24585 [bacterium]